MNARMIASLAAVVALAALAGCAPTAGYVTGVGPELGSKAPDVEYVSSEGRKASFNKARYPVALVAFAAPEGPNCCWVDPQVVELADAVRDLPVTVAQFSVPKGECPHGADCVETCNLNEGGLVSLCDGRRLAWNAYGRPEPGSLILVGPDDEVLMTGTLAAPGDLVAKARALGEAEKAKRPAARRRDIY